MTNTFHCAGHNFDRYTDRCDCGKRWLDIHDADETCLNTNGWAHVGHLVRRELDEIVAERDRRARVYWEATQNRSSVTADEPLIDRADPIEDMLAAF